MSLSETQSRAVAHGAGPCICLASLAGLVLVLFWVLPYISQLFESIKELFAL